uniref:YggS family pyridoxal phosphate-dependent enzyme n=1 Tax=Massilibacillus massiliensis TaxID=1806837 RepID=UPI000B11F999|nr:YggS family pyridoxal phosphate-dependent enzyme [Massilibacillus massiliensis]
MILERLTQIREDIEVSIANRKNTKISKDVKMIAVTKNHDVYEMRKAIDLGILEIGENRIQEALEKKAVLERNVRWNLIGHLQTNKVKKAVEMFDLIQSVDSEKLALEINKAASQLNKRQDILIQVNVSNEKSKFGIDSDEVFRFAAFISSLKNIRLCGLMTIAPHYENTEMTRPIFKQLFQIFTDLKNKNLENTEIKWLSMGMTNDFKIAIEEGSNVIRIGTGIFGQRQY